MALSDQRRTQSRACWSQRANPSSELARVHGARFRELMGDAGYIEVKSLPNIAPEQTRDARARAWSFVFECYEDNKAAGAIRGEGGADLNGWLRASKEVKPGT